MGARVSQHLKVGELEYSARLDLHVSGSYLLSNLLEECCDKSRLILSPVRPKTFDERVQRSLEHDGEEKASCECRSPLFLLQRTLPEMAAK